MSIGEAIDSLGKNCSQVHETTKHFAGDMSALVDAAHPTLSIADKETRSPPPISCDTPSRFTRGRSTSREITASGEITMAKSTRPSDSRPPGLPLEDFGTFGIQRPQRDIIAARDEQVSTEQIRRRRRRQNIPRTLVFFLAAKIQGKIDFYGFPNRT
nr:unnamed protein product [Spirometra erinaceieuropaei]